MNHLGTKLLETDRLILREFVPEDAPAMYKNWASEPQNPCMRGTNYTGIPYWVSGLRGHRVFKQEKLHDHLALNFKALNDIRNPPSFRAMSTLARTLG